MLSQINRGSDERGCGGAARRLLCRTQFNEGPADIRAGITICIAIKRITGALQVWLPTTKLRISTDVKDSGWRYCRSSEKAHKGRCMDFGGCEIEIRDVVISFVVVPAKRYV